MPESELVREAMAELSVYYLRNGYLRCPDGERRTAEGWSAYKKGFELRLVAASEEELAHLQALLARAGFEPGRPFQKARQWRIPLYGRGQVGRFLGLLTIDA